MTPREITDRAFADRSTVAAGLRQLNEMARQPDADLPAIEDAVTMLSRLQGR